MAANVANEFLRLAGPASDANTGLPLEFRARRITVLGYSALAKIVRVSFTLQTYSLGGVRARGEAGGRSGHSASDALQNPAHGEMETQPTSS